ncbi:hypothetical protein NEOLEDRAFT_1067707, partial [Neolentinus lepideus HHB14362 ss-1]
MTHVQDDLHTAGFHLTAVSERAELGPIRGKALCDLGRISCIHFEENGDLRDAEISIRHHETAVTLLPDLKEGLIAHHYLCEALIARYKRFGDISDLNTVIRKLEPLLRSPKVGSAPASHRAVAHSCLASAYRLRHLTNRSPDDCQAAIDSYQAALYFGIRPHVRASTISLYGLTLQSHPEYEMDSVKGEDMRANATLALLQANEMTPARHRDKPMRLGHYGNALLGQFRKSGWPEQVHVALQAHRDALSATTESDPHRITHLRNLGLTLVHSSTALSAPDNVREDRLSQQHVLRDPSVLGLPSDAARAGIDSGNLNGALELLENGRSILWTQMFHLRTPVADLVELNPELAADIQQVGKSLEYSSTKLQNERPHLRRHLAVRWETLIQQVRQLPGFDRFLLPKTVTDLANSVDGGSCVIFTAAKDQCDALIFDQGQVKHVPLSKFNREKIESLAIRTNDSSADALNPRLWLCPTGPFSRLPMHAAGLYTKGKADCLSDRFIVSYTPTLSALLNAR